MIVGCQYIKNNGFDIFCVSLNKSEKYLTFLHTLVGEKGRKLIVHQKG